MDKREFGVLLGAVIILTLVFGFYDGLRGSYNALLKYFIFAAIIITTAVIGKKVMANALDTKVTHELWHMERVLIVSKDLVFGFTKKQGFGSRIPMGIFIPLLITVLTAGFVKFTPILTYEPEATKYHAAKRFGTKSTLLVSEEQNALIAASSAFALFALAIIVYFLLPAQVELSKLSIYYALSNLIPISKLDGAQLFFGSRLIAQVVWVISALFFLFALLI